MWGRCRENVARLKSTISLCMHTKSWSHTFFSPLKCLDQHWKAIFCHQWSQGILNKLSGLKKTFVWVTSSTSGLAEVIITNTNIRLVDLIKVAFSCDTSWSDVRNSLIPINQALTERWLVRSHQPVQRLGG